MKIRCFTIAILPVILFSLSINCFSDDIYDDALMFIEFGAYYHPSKISGTFGIYNKTSSSTHFEEKVEVESHYFGFYLGGTSKYLQAGAVIGFGIDTGGPWKIPSGTEYDPNGLFEWGLRVLARYPFSPFNEGFFEIAPLGGVEWKFPDYKGIYLEAGLGMYIGPVYMESLYHYRIGDSEFAGSGDYGSVYESKTVAKTYGHFSVKMAISLWVSSYWKEHSRIGDTSYGTWERKWHLRGAR
jgi:hypothetical protein